MSFVRVGGSSRVLSRISRSNGPFGPQHVLTHIEAHVEGTSLLAVKISAQIVIACKTERGVDLHEGTGSTAMTTAFPRSSKNSAYNAH